MGADGKQRLEGGKQHPRARVCEVCLSTSQSSFIHVLARAPLAHTLPLHAHTHPCFLASMISLMSFSLLLIMTGA